MGKSKGEISSLERTSVKSRTSEEIFDFENSEESFQIDLLDMFSFLLGKLHFIVLSLLIGAVLFNAYSYFCIKPTYSSTAKIYVVSASNDSVVDLSDINVGTSLAKDYEELIRSYPVLSKVVANLDLECQPQDINGMISIENPEDTRILEITAVHTDPEVAMKLANEMTNVAIKYLPNTMNTNAPNIAEKGRYNDVKIGPGYTKYTLIGGFLGALVACIIFIIRYLMDDTIHSDEEMEKYFGMVPLATIPENDTLFVDDSGEYNSKQEGSI